MLPRRILSLWFPRLAVDLVMRKEPQLAGLPLGVVADRRGSLVIANLSAEAEAIGLRRGMALGDAKAIRPDLLTRPEDMAALSGFLAALRCWAGRFTPWVAEDDDGLVLDVSGCAHLFGGEAGLVAAVEGGAARIGLALRLGLADTFGAAWALARYAGADSSPAFTGDAIDQEARATRSRAQKRHWGHGGPPATPEAGLTAVIAPPGETMAWIGPLPVAALRLDPAAVAALQELGLRRIADVAAQPRAPLIRRTGPEVALRLDQAVGRVAEPVAPAPPPAIFALRLGFPEPIGLTEDVLAGVDRLLPPLCDRLADAGRGLRRLRLSLLRSDGGVVQREIGLARPTVEPPAIRAILSLALGEVDVGFGLDGLRLEALETEPVPVITERKLPGARAEVREAEPEAADLVGRLGARLGLEALLRLHPAESHVPEKATTEMAAAFVLPPKGWAPAGYTRPPLLFPPEAITLLDDAVPPTGFVWRRQACRRRTAWGPERLTPEWWLDDPAWRSGPRDYWRIETEDGLRLWLYAALGGELAAGWFAQGVFA